MNTNIFDTWRHELYCFIKLQHLTKKKRNRKHVTFIERKLKVQIKFKKLIHFQKNFVGKTLKILPFKIFSLRVNTKNVKIKAAIGMCDLIWPRCYNVDELLGRPVLHDMYGGLGIGRRRWERSVYIFVRINWQTSVYSRFGVVA